MAARKLQRLMGIAKAQGLRGMEAEGGAWEEPFQDAPTEVTWTQKAKIRASYHQRHQVTMESDSTLRETGL